MSILRNSFKDNYIFLFLLFVWVVSIPFKNAVYQISTSLLVLFFIVYIVKNRDFVYIKKLIERYKYLIYSFILIIFSMCISNLFNVVNTNAWTNILMFIFRYGLIFCILIYFYSKSLFNKKLLLYFMVISLFIQLLAGIYESIFIFGIENLMKGIDYRLTGFTFHPNNYSFFMGIGFLIILFSFNNTNNYKKNILLIVALIFFSYVILFTYSRATWIAVFVSLIIYIIFNFKSLKLNHLIILVLIGSIVCVTLFNVEIIHQRLISMLNGDSSRRVDDIWLPAIELIKQKFIIGHGINIFNTHNDYIQEVGGFHNVTIEILFYTGILGLFAFSTLFFQTIKEIYNQKNIYYFIILIFVFVDSQFDQSIFAGKTYLSTLIIFMFFVFSNRVERIK